MHFFVKCFDTQVGLNLDFSFGASSNRLCASRHFNTHDDYGNIEPENRGASCEGDSGGPLFCLDVGDDGYKLQGIVSLGNLFQHLILSICPLWRLWHLWV